VHEAGVTELEAAIADTGALLVRLQKYTRAAGPEGATLGREALALGDVARRLHRHELLDAAATTTLLAEARALADRLRALLTDLRRAPDYRAAVAAHVAGDQATLARVLPEVFAGLEGVPPLPQLFAPVEWLRRGRRRPAPDVAADIVRVRDEGLLADGDDLSPGADAELPAVVLAAEPPADEPVVLQLPGAALPPTYRLVDTGELLVYVPRLRVPGLSILLAPALAEDEQRRVEIPAEEWRAWRAELAQAVAAAGIALAVTRSGRAGS
jgi:hypothetical protein